jgi:hypothetical protein
LKPCKLTDVTRSLGKPSDWNNSDSECETLDIHDLTTENGNFMISVWELDDNDMDAITKTRRISLGIRGFEHPVISLGVVSEIHGTNQD